MMRRQVKLLAPRRRTPAEQQRACLRCHPATPCAPSRARPQKGLREGRLPARAAQRGARARAHADARALGDESAWR
eukprot:scaffold15_cov354-Prasinococcus_capsulatus_cf.AAC.8